MRKIVASIVVATIAFIAAPAMAADMPEYPDIEIPDIEYGDSFYLRGSAALNLQWAREVRHAPNWTGQIVHPIDSLGYGYSWGAGFGYETGTGLRFDATIDMLETSGIGITKTGLGAPDVNGRYKLMLRSTLALANAYYDFSFGDFGFGSDGFFGYVGAGAGVGVGARAAGAVRAAVGEVAARTGAEPVGAWVRGPSGAPAGVSEALAFAAMRAPAAAYPAISAESRPISAAAGNAPRLAAAACCALVSRGI